METFEAVKSGYLNTFNFKGRASRSEFWKFFWILGVLWLVLKLVDYNIIQGNKMLAWRYVRNICLLADPAYRPNCAPSA